MVGFSGFFAQQSAGQEDFFSGLLLYEHLGGVCAICVFSQQLMTNCSLTSLSVQLDSFCGHGQG